MNTGEKEVGRLDRIYLSGSPYNEIKILSELESKPVTRHRYPFNFAKSKLLKMANVCSYTLHSDNISLIFNLDDKGYAAARTLRVCVDGLEEMRCSLDCSFDVFVREGKGFEKAMTFDLSGDEVVDREKFTRFIIQLELK